ncbi:hypothetical protein CRM22_007700 [Opisthorchis felineus]|uniref:Uncharacterized protein n=1 Tax=Opisthorchis felineus TaxID=147828 RepID=A0A4S2LEI4_OPIFE|nr:hypothetical protein CRM22_007700 [Opisthorchis felineus]
MFAFTCSKDRYTSVRVCFLSCPKQNTYSNLDPFIAANQMIGKGIAITDIPLFEILQPVDGDEDLFEILKSDSPSKRVRYH